MITAYEPLEFIPRGRQAVEKHPGPLITNKKKTNTSSEHFLLYRLQNVNISLDDDTEFWTIHEQPIKQNLNINLNENLGFFNNFSIQNEDELYVKGNTAVWHKGTQTRMFNSYETCFSCETPIKFAFFCSADFINAELQETKCGRNSVSDDVCICLIDTQSLKVFCDDGEHYISTLDFPVSNVWPTKYGIIFEKEPLSTTINTQPINFPRVFSLSHPLEEIRPILFKPHIGTINYFTEADYKIIFTSWDRDLVLFYDFKNGLHFICLIRKVLEHEVELVNLLNETIASGFNISTQTSRPNSAMHNHSSKFGANITKGHTSTFVGKTSFNNNSNQQSSMNRTGGSISHLARLQSTLGVHMSTQDMRKMGEIAPSKPIIPDLCFETIWVETGKIAKKYSENASHGFLHTDFIGQNYMCYLLPRTCELNLVRMVKLKNNYSFDEVVTVTAKDAVGLKQLNVIVVLAPCGTVILYSGCSLIGKVHLGGILSSIVTSSNLQYSFSSGSLPRRSSLLPTLSITPDTKFEDELHTLSPVHPLQSNFLTKNGQCGGLRDGAGNRVTIEYPGGKLFRFALPVISESILITKCMLTIKNILQSDLALSIIIKWYGVRNAPGTKDISPQKEWQMFSNFLLDVMGYNLSQRDKIIQGVTSTSPLDEPKKRRKDDNTEGSDSDWNFLINYLNKSYNLKDNLDKTENVIQTDCNAALFNYIPTILFAFHLVYEDLKLDMTLKPVLEPLADFLYRLSLLLKLDHYALHYFIDFPKLINIESTNSIENSVIENLNHIAYLNKPVPSIFNYIYNMLNGSYEKYPILLKINYKTFQIIKILQIIYENRKTLDEFITIENLKTEDIDTNKYLRKKNRGKTLNENIINCLLDFKVTRNYLENLPIAIYAMISNTLDEIRIDAPTGSTAEAYDLLLRPELVAHAKIVENKFVGKNEIQNPVQKEHSLSPRILTIPDIIPKTDVSSEEDGMEHMDTKLLRLRFPTDLRVNDVCYFLNSSTPVIVDMVQAPNISDHEFIEEQEKYLYAMTIRTMALPLGRGMFTLRTSTPTVTESLSIPKLCLSGKDATKGSTIEIQQIEVPANMNTWPLFHNGVAAGLRITAEAKDIDSTWIVYNKPKGITEIQTEHAGFLMALGLNGHLKSLSFMSIYEYLVKCDEMMSLGLLLGISAAHRGTMDQTTTKLLSVHIEALLPPTALELDIPQNIQIASIMGIGLLYQGSAKRHIAEILLQEIGRPPGPEMENSVERESYALTTGLALGLVTLGQGESSPGLRDLQLTDNLHYYMVGGNKRPLSGSQKDKYKLASFQIREGHAVNIDVTAPGAILALGLMFFNTNNVAVANWMKPPETRYLLDFVRPDLLLLRIIAKGIIMWESIEPSSEWILSQFPKSLSFDLQNGPSTENNNNNIDHEANCQAYCNVITGAAFCVGLRYAGTENEKAYKTLESIIQLFLTANTQYLGKFAGNSTIESCLVTVLLSLSLVYAGTGNLNIIRLIRMLRARIGSSNYSVTYGSHMAIHMSLGFLFLGAGRFTLSRSPESIAALICTLFPKFPNHSNDNRYHLQAFRHLYVLAVEPRLILPRDIDSGKLTTCRISYIQMGSTQLIPLRNAPCMLPELKTIKAILIDDPYFWKISFERDRNWNQLIKILENCECIDLKQKAGSFSTNDGPKKSKQYLTQTIKINQYNHWKVDLNDILSFSNDTTIVNLINNFFVKLKQNLIDYTIEINEEHGLNSERTVQQQLLLQANNCLNNDKMHSFSVGLGLMMIWNNLQKSPNSYDIWQFKIIDKFLIKLNIQNSQFISNTNILWNEILKSLIIKLQNQIELWTNENLLLIRKFIVKNLNDNDIIIYLKNQNLLNLMKLTTIVSYYNFPINFLDINLNEKNLNYLELIMKIKHFNLDDYSIRCLWKILNATKNY